MSCDEGRQLWAADLFLPLEEELDVDRQGSVCLQHRLNGKDRGQHIALIVGGATRIDPAVAYGGLERWASPQLQRVGRLGIKVAVNQDGWFVRRVQPLPVHHGVAAGRQY